MKRLLTTLMLSMGLLLAYGQGTIQGKVWDTEMDEPLIGASVYLLGTTMGTVTDLEGKFMISNVDPGAYTLEVSYTGYETQSVNISVEKGINMVDRIDLNSSVIGLSEIEVIASVAVDRKTPVAVSTIDGSEVSALVGNQEYPEILRKTPSIYVTKQGGGFGDSRINVRGFDQRNTAVMINGIPVNDMENGWVYWSNWAGLADVTSKLQVQRGLGASKLAVASVGGSINIITDAAKMGKGGVAGVSIGNDGYQKYSVALSTGLSENGWAFTVQGTHTRGDGYVDGTMFRAYSYFASVTKIFNDQHSLSATVLGAPQWHHQRLFPGNFDNINLRTFDDPDDPNNENPATGRGIKWNWVYGDLNGEEFSFRRNFYHKPKVFINHYWNISEKTELKTSAYFSLGLGGGTGPRGRLRTPGSVFDSFGGFGEGIHDENGQIRFNDLVAYNQGSGAFPEWGQKVPASSGPFEGQFVNTSDGRFMGSGEEGTGFIRRASMNYHTWTGILSTLGHDLGENLTLIAGLDARYYKGEHFRRLENLLGADAYLSRANVNNPENYITDEAAADFGNFYNNSFKKGDDRNVLNYYNDGLVSWIGLFGQLEYTQDKVSVFASFSGSNQGFKRIDYFNYLDADTPDNDINNDGEYQESDWENFLGGTIKAGFNYNINEQHNVYVNGGYFSRQPIFDNVFINFVNDVNEDVENQTVTALEAGYGFRSANFNARVNIYHTDWGNRQFDESFNNYEYIFQGDTLQVEALAVFENVAQLHQGVEVELDYSPINKLRLFGMVSVGNWRFTDNFETTLTDTDNNREIPGAISTLYTEDLKVGDAAQTTFSIGADYEIVRGLNIYADYYYADDLYAEYNILDPQFFQPGGEVVKLPSYELVDAGVSYTFDLSGTDVTLRLNVNNVLDEMYVSELDTNILDDPSTAQNEFYDNQGIFGFGRTWNTGLKVRF